MRSAHWPAGAVAAVRPLRACGCCPQGPFDRDYQIRQVADQGSGGALEENTFVPHRMTPADIDAFRFRAGATTSLKVLVHP